jgi:hypothetical protein
VAGETALAADLCRDGIRRFDDAESGGFRPPLVGFFGCDDVLIEGVAVEGAGPSAAIHLARCERATVRAVRLRDAEGPDARGIVAEGSRDVRVSGLHVVSGRHGVSLRAARNRGGVIERIDVAGVSADRLAGSALFVGAEQPAFAGAADGAGGAPLFRQIHARRVASLAAGRAVSIVGVPERCVEDVTLHDLDLRATEGLSCTSISRLWLRDCRATPTFGPDLALRDARDVWIDGIRHDRPAGTFLDLRGRRTARVHLASARDATVRPSIVLGVDVPRDALVQD